MSRKILEWIEDHRRDLLDFVCDLVATPSMNPPGDEAAVASKVAQRLRNLGITSVKVVEKEERRSNIVAETGRGDGPTLLLNGHLDTKPHGPLEQWETDPLTPTVRGGFLHGLGVADMKAAVAAIVYAAAALSADTAALPGRLIVALSADEEAGGRLGSDFLARNLGLRADYGIVAEPSGVAEEWESLGVMCRGFSAIRFKVGGTRLHSSLIGLEKTVNASVKAGSLLAKMERGFPIRFEPHPFCPEGVVFNPGAWLKGGDFYGTVPGLVEFGVDVRTLPGMSKEETWADLEAFLARARAEDPDLEVEASFEEGSIGWNPGVEIDSRAPVVASCLKAAEAVLGRRPRLAAFPGGTDAAAWTNIAGIPTIPAFGPGLLTRAHRPNERIRIEAPVEAAKILALVADDLVRRP